MRSHAMPPIHESYGRRNFLAGCLAVPAAMGAGLIRSRDAAAEERPAIEGITPPVVGPRATSGDDRQEPEWAERMTVTVGTRSGDIRGRDDKALQAAVDYLARYGG